MSEDHRHERDAEQTRDADDAGDAQARGTSQRGPTAAEAPAAEDWKRNVKSEAVWMRLLHMLVLALFFGLAEFVLGVVVITQFVVTLLSGRQNEPLLQFGQGLASYAYQILLFLTYNSQERPFPFAEWPDGPPQTGRRPSE